MKKIIAIVALAVALTSCTGREYTHDEWQENHDRDCASHITKFNYEGHSYLLYSNGPHGVGITHDANCECREEFCDD